MQIICAIGGASGVCPVRMSWDAAVLRSQQKAIEPGVSRRHWRGASSSHWGQVERGTVENKT